VGLGRQSGNTATDISLNINNYLQFPTETSRIFVNSWFKPKSMQTVQCNELALWQRLQSAWLCGADCQADCTMARNIITSVLNIATVNNIMQPQLKLHCQWINAFLENANVSNILLFYFRCMLYILILQHLCQLFVCHDMGQALRKIFFIVTSLS